jgi:hypothetical protein
VITFCIVQMIKMMITCVATFTLCWLPFNILLVVSDRYNVYDYEHIEFVWFGCHWLAMSHAAQNPLVYIWMNARFRYGFRCVLGKCLPCLMPNIDHANGRSLANIFNTSQRKRMASQYYNCYSYSMADNAHSLICHPSKTSALVSRHRVSEESSQSCPKNSLQKRFSYASATSRLGSPTRLNGNGQALTFNNLNCHNSGEMVKSRSYNGEPMTRCGSMHSSVKDSNPL